MGERRREAVSAVRAMVEAEGSACLMCEGRCAFCARILSKRPAPRLGWCAWCDVTYFASGAELGDVREAGGRRRAEQRGSTREASTTKA